jgi:hypothetical protein
VKGELVRPVRLLIRLQHVQRSAPPRGPVVAENPDHPF